MELSENELDDYLQQKDRLQVQTFQIFVDHFCKSGSIRIVFVGAFSGMLILGTREELPAKHVSKTSVASRLSMVSVLFISERNLCCFCFRLKTSTNHLF